MVNLHRLVVSGAMVMALLSSIVGCGTSKTPVIGSSSTAGRPITTVSNRTSMNRQEIVQARGCLKRELVRPARHTPGRQEAPRRAGEMTRDGLPMTPQEYEATVRRCLTLVKSASASATHK